MKFIKKYFLAAIMLFGMGMGSSKALAENADYSKVIPLPNSIVLTKGKAFELNEKTKILYPDNSVEMKKNAQLLSDFIFEFTAKRLEIAAKGSKKNAIILKKGLKNSNKEAYSIVVNKNRVVINGASGAGVFYGIETFRKATPIDAKTVSYPAGKITAEPRFGYRGMMLDVGRHFESAEFVKKYIDILALHNINRFHWHLTEDQGWRIEIKKYPKLTEIGAWRKETVIGQNSGKFDGKPYGGFYTQDQIKDIVKYAQDRYITIVPEIDLPGHMLAALASYPDLGCTGGPYEVGTQWGVFDDVLCIGKESTFTFLEDVLTEVMDLFPSEYIHIGGDECPKVRWEKCPLCQARIKELGLKDDAKHKKEFYLQSYVTERIENFLNKHNRKIIGWDEILEGKLAPNATVMSWRGMEGGLEAVKMGHDAIMTPSNYVYFDHYQTTDIKNEPLAIGGYSPVERVYNFEPVPPTLTPAEQKHILGAQANLWTEYIPTEKQAEYMTMPRIAALAEVQWLQPEKKNYSQFLKRLPALLKVYDKLGYTYATHLFDITAKLVPNTEKRTLDITFSTIDNAPIYFTTDGTEPTKNSILYTKTIPLAESATIKAKAIRANGKTSRTYEETINLSKSSLKPIELLTKPDPNFTFGGKGLLNDGVSGQTINYKTGRWMGFQGTDLVAIIDLEKEMTISKSAIQNCVVTGDWVMDAGAFNVYVSNDGKNFKKVAGQEINPNDRAEHWKGLVHHTLTFDPTTARYVKVEVKVLKQFPKWHRAQGKPYIFVDEIAID